MIDVLHNKEYQIPIRLYSFLFNYFTNIPFSYIFILYVESVNEIKKKLNILYYNDQINEISSQAEILFLEKLQELKEEEYYDYE